MMELDDQNIIQKIQAGDSHAFAELVRKYNSRVRGYCRMMLRDSAQGDDAAQEIFIKVYESLSKFRGDASFSTWLYRIMNFHCLDLLRKISRSRSESWEALLEKEGDQIEYLMTTSPASPSFENTREVLSKILASLPDSLREILILRELQGLSYEELCSTLNCSLDAVKSRLKRAREALEEKVRHLSKEKYV